MAVTSDKLDFRNIFIVMAVESAAQIHLSNDSHSEHIKKHFLSR